MWPGNARPQNLIIFANSCSWVGCIGEETEYPHCQKSVGIFTNNYARKDGFVVSKIWKSDDWH